MSLHENAFVVDTTITGNSATLRGGGISVDRSGEFQFLRTTVSGNSAESGGGMYLRLNDRLSVVDCVIADNIATKNGGGAYVDFGAQIFSSVFRNNVAGEDGAGIWADSPLELYGTTVSENTAQDYGGGIFTTDYLLTSELLSPETPQPAAEGCI